MMNLLRAYKFLIIGLLLSACQSEKADTQQTFDLASENAIFRNVKMGDTPDAIQKAETAEPIFLSDTLMHYQAAEKYKDSELQLSIYYTIDEFGLFEIQADYYSEFSIQDSLLATIKTRLNSRYGQPSKRFESFRWTTPSASNTLIEISLSKEKDPDLKPFISLNYLEPLNEQL